MVLEEITRQRQLDVLELLFEVNKEIDSEFEAHRLITETFKKIKLENNLEHYNITAYVKDDLKRKWKNSKGESNEFIKIFMNEIDAATENYEVSRSEVLFLYSLCPYLLWEENLLVDKDGLPLNQKRLCEELDLNRRIVSDRMKSLEHKKCLIRIYAGRDVYFLVNPNLMFKGQEINKSLPKLFDMIGYEYKNTKIKTP